MEGDDFVVFVYVKKLDVMFEEVSFLHGVEHGLVKVAELMKFKVGVIPQGPLATGIVMCPVITFARKVDPFGMSEFVAHKVEVTVVGGSEGNEARHFM